MKYLVNRETKEHRLYTEGDYNRLGHIHGKWDVVEADEEGWIPWEGGECPLPDGFECEIQTKEGERLLSREAKRWTWSPNIGDATITHYRQILAEKEEWSGYVGADEQQPPPPMQSVFDRLKSAIAASESIPAIIAEIDAMLPEGYCVVKRGAEQPAEHPAEGMTDWRNWREGDLVTVHGNKGHYSDEDYKDGKTYRVVEVFAHGLEIGSERRDSLFFSEDEIDEGQLRYHSRPAKVTE